MVENNSLDDEVRSNRADEFASLSERILRCTGKGVARSEFLTRLSVIILEFTKGEAFELRVMDPCSYLRWEFSKEHRSPRFTVLENPLEVPVKLTELNDQPNSVEDLCRALIEEHEIDLKPPLRSTRRGNLWIGGEEPESLDTHIRPPSSFSRAVALMLIRFVVDERTVGLLLFQDFRSKRVTERDVEFYERVADIIGLAIAHQQAQWALRERVKELTCLYEIGRVAQLRKISLQGVLQRILEFLPSAWQFPEIAGARIILDGRSYNTERFATGPHRQTADLIVRGSVRGIIEVSYNEDRPEFVEGPFLAEERSLIDTVARELSLIVDGREADEHQSKLQAQLRHADRLATIGQLAAGVAHELNEPLGNILGFAQLLQKDSDLPERASNDVGKIVRASLHAREVIHKLLVFSRQRTPVLSLVNLNRIVQDGLYFLESRCSRAGIQVLSNLAPELPDINADSSQLHQVLVNLVVNSIQAIRSGGVITIDTAADPESVSLKVSDTGCGMTDDTKAKIFTPFFTTKDVDEGTGLGLAVVHGIISSHGGSIRVESAPGKGTSIEIRLPLAAAAEVSEV